MTMQPHPPTDTSTAVDDLATLRDWLRFAISRFEAAGLVYGHGTETALDEAAFLLLSSLGLPIDGLEPWLDARLLRDERIQILELIEKRISSRKPAAYLVGFAWIGGHRFHVDERVIVPRSYIGELLARDALSTVVPDANKIRTVLDLCTGSGCLAILAALAFPNATVDAADISQDALAVATRNIGEYELEDRVRLVCSDLFAGLDGRSYDLIVANPPYVTTRAVEAFPPEYRAEPVLAHLGGEDGLDLVRRIIQGAAEHLAAGGSIVVEIGQARPSLELAYPSLPFLWLDTEDSQGEVFALAGADLLAPNATRAAGSALRRKRDRGR